MDKKYASINTFARIRPIEKVNDEFALCKICVQSVGKNRNYSYMSKDNITKELPTLNYVPVIGHLMPKYDDDGNVIGHYLGGHDYEITPDLKFRPLTVPFGVVVEDSFNFEMVSEFGKEEEYLTAMAYLWVDRFPDLKDAIYDDNVWFNQSMEISVNEYRPLEEDSNYTEILDWSYSGLCLLNKSDDPNMNVEPCFISAQVMPVDYSHNKAEFAKEMEELKTKLNSALKEGGKTNLKFSEEARNAILAEFKITIEDIDFDITEDMTEEEFRKSVESKFGTGDNTPSVPDDTAKFSATYNQKRDAIREALPYSSERDVTGKLISETDYWMQDFDNEYVFVERDIWTDSGMQEDHGRFKYTFDETTMTATVSGDFEVMILKWLTLSENQQIEESRKEFDSLREFKKTRLEADHKNAVDDVLNEFEDIADSEEFKAFSENVYNIEDLDEIKTKCYAIRGKLTPVKFNKKEDKKTLKVPLTGSGKSDSKYGELFAMYSKK